jgi:hypothetical protein
VVGCVVLFAPKITLALSILSDAIDRMFKSGKSAVSFPSTHHFNSPSFFPGVFTRTMNS